MKGSCYVGRGSFCYGVYNTWSVWVSNQIAAYHTIFIWYEPCFETWNLHSTNYTVSEIPSFTKCNGHYGRQILQRFYKDWLTFPHIWSFFRRCNILYQTWLNKVHTEAEYWLTVLPKLREYTDHWTKTITIRLLSAFFELDSIWKLQFGDDIALYWWLQMNISSFLILLSYRTWLFCMFRKIHIGFILLWLLCCG